MTQQQDRAEVIREVLTPPETLDDLSAQVEKQHAHGGRMEQQSARDLEVAVVAAARQRLERGEVPTEELVDIRLPFGARQAQ